MSITEAQIEIFRENARNAALSEIDDIWTYGSLPQSKLAEFSKAVTQVVARSKSNEAADTMNEILAHLRKLVPPKQMGWLARLFRKRLYSTENLRLTINEIDDAVVKLRLWQAQLLKDNKIFEFLERDAEECCAELNVYITEGEARLKAITDEHFRSSVLRRLAELHTSYAVADQGLSQVKLMRQNGQVTVSKLEPILTSTIPLWRNQIALALGLGQYDAEQQLHRKIADIAAASMNHMGKTVRRRGEKVVKAERHHVDPSEVARMNASLETELTELVSVIRSSNEMIHSSAVV